MCQERRDSRESWFCTHMEDTQLNPKTDPPQSAKDSERCGGSTHPAVCGSGKGAEWKLPPAECALKKNSIGISSFRSFARWFSFPFERICNCDFIWLLKKKREPTAVRFLQLSLSQPRPPREEEDYWWFVSAYWNPVTAVLLLCPSFFSY